MNLSSTLVAVLVLLLVLSPGCAGRRDVAETPAAIAADGAQPPPLESEAEPEPVAVAEPEPPAEPEPVAVAVAEPESEPAELATQALEAVESAEQFWAEGDLDNALLSLDRAYELMLALPEDDPDWGQQKQDLRHLVSRRIVEIYGSRLTTASDPGSPIPVEINRHVEREIQSFQGPERQFFIDSYRRSGLYRPMIVEMLAEAGLPKELSWLPLVESGFKTRALSRARALGMWQFISSTGYRYGLGRSTWIDERMDPRKATRAAIDYLSELHGLFGDWMVALASYNCGEHRVASVIRRQQNGYLDHFWDLFEQLPWETARYVPRFLATLAIVRDPDAYGFELPEPLPAAEAVAVTIDRHARLEDLDRELGLDKGTLVELNPELRRGVTPDAAYELRVPAEVADSFSTVVARMPAYTPPREQYVVHRVRRGETLSLIASRYRTSVSAIVRANHLRSRNRISIGQRLKIPTRGGGRAVAASVAASGESATRIHTVRRGDNLWKLASLYGTTVDRIKRDNGLRGDGLAVGQKLTIQTGPLAGARIYSVRRGDTIGKIARAHGVSIAAVLAANGLSRSSVIYPGQRLVIPD